MIRLSSTFAILLLSITTKPIYSSNELTSESTYARMLSGGNETAILRGSNIFNGSKSKATKGKKSWKSSKLIKSLSLSKKGQKKSKSAIIYPSSMPSGKKKSLRMQVTSSLILFSGDFDRCPDVDEIREFEKEKFEFQQEHYDNEHAEGNFNMMGLSMACDENDQGVGGTNSSRRELQGGSRRALRTRSSATFKPPPKRKNINTAESKLASSKTVTANAINQDRRRRLQQQPSNSTHGTVERLLEKFSQNGNPYLGSIYDVDVANIVVTFRKDDDYGYGEVDEDYDYYANN